MRATAFLIAGLAFALGLVSGPSHAARLALVIGNDSYTKITPLRNARADARAIGRSLESAGFDVSVAIDLDRSGMNAAIRQFRARLAGGDDAVFYFSGHGVQLGGTSYLLPTDIQDDDVSSIKDDAIPLQRVLEDLAEQKARFSLIIVDACRDNPFSSKGRALSTRGLAPTSPADGQMVIYSAGAGQQALDRLGDADRSPNGLFTRVFLKEIEQSGVPIHDAVRRVRKEVVRLARSVGHEQVPALYDQSIGEFFFRKGEPVEVIAAKPDLREVPTPREPTPPTVPEAGSRGPARAFRDCDTCPEMVVLPAGEFEMGSGESEGDADERPLHRVRVPGFAMGRYEVTQGQWKSLMGSNPSGFKACGDDCPVEQVTWNDAQSFVRKLNQVVSGREDGPYRLPSEAEWEYACRGGVRQRYCGSDDPARVAWYQKNTRAETQKVGGKAPNGFGLHDMSGNVWEWVQDCWNPNYAGAPTDGSAWSRDGCSARLFRGGSWSNPPPYLRAAERFKNEPSKRVVLLGFRVARSLP